LKFSVFFVVRRVPGDSSSLKGGCHVNCRLNM
jgi:hypothetical protein